MPSDSDFSFDKGEFNNIVELGQLNEINFSIFKPIKLNIDVKLLNNNIPPFYIEFTDLKNFKSLLIITFEKNLKTALLKSYTT